VNLTPEQKNAVATWIAAGDSLSDVQKKLFGQFKISMTYMDIHFLVDDLELTLKDPAPPPAAPPPSPAAPVPPPPQTDPAARSDIPNRAPLDEDEAFEPATDDQQTRPAPTTAGEFADDAEPPAAPPTSVRLEVDNVTLIPGALASGSVTFSDGVTGKWIVDNYGRPGFTQISQPDYRPTAADADAFMRQLSTALQKRGY
jgi:hypothetical protein